MIRFLQIHGRRIACWVNNASFLPERKTLVFIHGAGGDHTNWIQQYTPLKNAYNIAALDLPGHGQSEGPGEREMAAYVGWVREILASLGIVEPVLIGHSLGAAICLSFVIRCEGAAAAVVPAGGGVRMPVNRLVLDGFQQDAPAAIALAVKYALAKKNQARLGGFLAESYAGVDPEVIHGDLMACNGLDIGEAVAGIRIPTLVLCGAEDRMTPPALSQRLKERIPGSRLSLIAGAGHFAMLEDPEAFNASLTEFLDSL